ncbi:MAG: hypothetical protein PUD20_10655, partial [bacterium]|nr:hypothetical protein [bacterium]
DLVKFFVAWTGSAIHIYPAGTLERLVLSVRLLDAYVPLPATSSESVPALYVAMHPKEAASGRF